YRGQLPRGGRLVARFRRLGRAARATRHRGRTGDRVTRDRLPGVAGRNRANEQDRDGCRSSGQRQQRHGPATPAPCPPNSVAALPRTSGGRSGPCAGRDYSVSTRRVLSLAAQHGGGFPLDGTTEPDVVGLRQLAGGEVVIEITQLTQQLATATVIRSVGPCVQA